jgi:phosphomannomutase
LKTRLEEEGFQILDIDGVKAMDENGWVLLRPSNTEPMIRIFAEGKTEEDLKRFLDLAKRILNEEAESVK